MEPATVAVFNKKGDYAQRLNHAIKQVDEWTDWIKRNEPYFRDSLQKALKANYSDFDEKLNYTRRFIVGSQIVIGRRAVIIKLVKHSGIRRGLYTPEQHIPSYYPTIWQNWMRN